MKAFREIPASYHVPSDGVTKIACYVDISECLCQVWVPAIPVHPVLRVEMSCRIGGFGHIHYCAGGKKFVSNGVIVAPEFRGVDRQGQQVVDGIARGSVFRVLDLAKDDDGPDAKGNGYGKL